MEYLGKHFSSRAYYLNLTEDFEKELPEKNWHVFVISNKKYDDSKGSLFEKFIRTAINKDLLAFQGQGKYGDYLHGSADSVIVDMIVNEGRKELEDIMTTGNNETDLANGLWEAFCATAFSDRVDYATVKLVCLSLDREDYRSELKDLIRRFNKGWLPSDSKKEEIDKMKDNSKIKKYKTMFSKFFRTKML